jgi:hypothetical protein
VKVNIRQLLSGIESEASRKESGNSMEAGRDLHNVIVTGDDNAITIAKSEKKPRAQTKTKELTIPHIPSSNDQPHHRHPL